MNTEIKDFLKGQCQEIFDPFLVKNSTVFGPPINVQKWLCELFRIRKELKVIYGR